MKGPEDHTDAVKRLLEAKETHLWHGANPVHSALPGAYLDRDRKAAVSRSTVVPIRILKKARKSVKMPVNRG